MQLLNGNGAWIITKSKPFSRKVKVSLKHCKPLGKQQNKPQGYPLLSKYTTQNKVKRLESAALILSPVARASNYDLKENLQEMFQEAV